MSGSPSSAVREGGRLLQKDSEYFIYFSVCQHVFGRVVAF